MKTCSKCKQTKPVTEFYRKQDSRDGRAPYCRECVKRAASEYLKADRAAAAARVQDWRQRNPERAAKHRATFFQAHRAWIYSERAARRQRMRARVPWFDQKLVRSYYRMAQALRRQGIDVHVDHIVPLKAKDACGLHVQTNLALAYGVENLRKGTRVIEPPKISRVRVFSVRRAVCIIPAHGLPGQSTRH